MRGMAPLPVLTSLFCLAGPGVAQVPQDIQLNRACIYCGMNREMYDFSRMSIEYDDGTATANLQPALCGRRPGQQARQSAQIHSGG